MTTEGGGQVYDASAYNENNVPSFFLV